MSYALLNVGNITRRPEGTINLRALSAPRSSGAARREVYSSRYRLASGARCHIPNHILWIIGMRIGSQNGACSAIVSNSPPDLVHVLYGDEQLDLLLRRAKAIALPSNCDLSSPNRTGCGSALRRPKNICFRGSIWQLLLREISWRISGIGWGPTVSFMFPTESTRISFVRASACHAANACA